MVAMPGEEKKVKEILSSTTEKEEPTDKEEEIQSPITKEDQLHSPFTLFQRMHYMPWQRIAKTKMLRKRQD